MVKWKHAKSPPSKILHNLLEISEQRSNGDIVFKSYDFFNELDLIKDHLKFEMKIDKSDENYLIKETIKECIRQHDVSPKKFLSLINHKYSELNIHEVERICLTSISLKQLSFKRIKIFNSSISFYENDFPKKYHSRSSYFNCKNIDSNDSYTKCVVKTKTASNQVDIHLDNLNIFRGLLNIMYNFKFEFLMSSEKKPINRIRLGEIHTIHNKYGRLINKGHWYELKFIQAETIKIEPKSKKDLIQIINRINSCPYKDEIKDSILFYCHALDDYDPNISLIMLWNALDKLMNKQSGNYDDIIRRAKGLFGNHSKHAEIINTFKIVRNDYVHRIKSHSMAREYCYKLQEYYNYILFFHIFKLSHLKSMDEALSCLDFNSKLRDKGQQRALKSSLEFLNLKFDL